MGGGGGSGGRLGNIKHLEEIAKEALARKRRNVFISFSFDDIDEVNLLRGQAKNDNSDIEFIDRSVRVEFKSAKADYIKDRLVDRINQASMTVVYLSSNTQDSTWVNWEVQRSLDLGKDIVAVHSGNTPPSNLPSFISRHNIAVVPWSTLPDILK